MAIPLLRNQHPQPAAIECSQWQHRIAQKKLSSPEADMKDGIEVSTKATVHADIRPHTSMEVVLEVNMVLPLFYGYWFSNVKM